MHHHTVIPPSAELPEAIKAKLEENAESLAILPAVAAEAISVTTDPNCSVDRFARIVERDPMLASDVLCMVNSAAYSAGTQIASLNEAVVRLGFRQCRNLILSTSIASLSKTVPLQEQWVREKLSQHGLAVATAAKYLNLALNVGFQGEEFAAGLVHDFGRVLIAAILPDEYTDADPLTFDEGPETLAMEQVSLGTNHCEVGAWFGQQNQLPESLVDVLRWHHVPETDCPHKKLVSLIAAADHVANHLQRGDLPESYDPSSNPGVRALTCAGIFEAETQFSEIAPALLDAVAKDVSSSHRTEM